MSKRITSNQHRILTELATGKVPTSFSPGKAMKALLEKGLVIKTTGSYRMNRRFSSDAAEVFRLTPAGLEALKGAAESTYRSDLRSASSTLKRTLRMLQSAEVVDAPRMEPVEGAAP